MHEEEYWNDVQLLVRRVVHRAAVELGSICPDEAKPAVALAMGRQGVEVDPTSWVCGQMASRALAALEAQGVLERRGRNRYEVVDWSDIEESTDHQLSSTGKIRTRGTGRLLRTREDSRGRELVDLKGRTFDVAKLRPVSRAVATPGLGGGIQ